MHFNSSRLLALAVRFHQRVDCYIANTVDWSRECTNDDKYPTEGENIVDSIAVLEQSLQKHQNLHDRITEAYHEVEYTTTSYEL